MGFSPNGNSSLLKLINSEFWKVMKSLKAFKEICPFNIITILLEYLLINFNEFQLMNLRLNLLN